MRSAPQDAVPRRSCPVWLSLGTLWRDQFSYLTRRAACSQVYAAQQLPACAPSSNSLVINAAKFGLTQNSQPQSLAASLAG
jgi:hypothetical protein